MRIPRFLLLTGVIAILMPSAAAAGSGSPALTVQSTLPTCGLPESDAETLLILNNYYPTRYWWDHTNLTIAVQPHPKATAAQINAVRDAIATWSEVLNECFDGLITLTDVTGTSRNPQSAADIVVHFVPTAGGVVFGGFAVCGTQNCPNVLVRSDLPLPFGVDPYSPEYIELVALHEIGHALGLGHTTNLESTDLMGYGWVGTLGAVLSQCDIDALAFVFAWAIEGTAPRPPDPGPFVCAANDAATRGDARRVRQQLLTEVPNAPTRR